MNKNVLGLLTIFFVSIYSVQCGIPMQAQENIIKKNNASCCRSESLNQPMFEYKMMGIRPVVLPRKDLEIIMGSSSFLLIAPVILVDLLAAVVLEKLSRAPNSKFLIVLSVLAVSNILAYTEVKKFCHEASAWLQVLKEKEASLKNES